MRRSPLCDQLGIDAPILSAGMGTVARTELAAAVSNGGGCGVLGSAGLPAAYIRDEIRRLRTMTAKPFGVNIIFARLTEGLIESCLEERVPLLVFFWGNPAAYVEEAHRGGTQLFVQVGSVEEAKAAADAGVDGLIAQGIEAGGHVRGTTSLWTLLPAVVEAVHPLPVLASGGIATGRGVAAAMMLGAQGVSIGSRFLCSDEAATTPAYQQRIVQSQAEDTLYTELFDVGWKDAPHRVLRNKTVAEWEAAGSPPSGQRPGEGSVIGSAPRGGKVIELVRYATNSLPSSGFVGDMEYGALYAGESCTLIHDVKPAGDIVRQLMADAEQAIAHFA